MIKCIVYYRVYRKKKGKSSKRKELRYALELSKETDCTLVVVKIDQLSRSTEDILEIYQELSRRLFN